MNKNRINHLARTALLLIMCATWGVASADETYSNGQPYYDSGVWYSLYYSNSALPNCTTAGCIDGSLKTASDFMGYLSSTSTNNQPAFAHYTPIGNPLTFDYFIDGTSYDGNSKGYKVAWGDGTVFHTWATGTTATLHQWVHDTVAINSSTRTNSRFYRDTDGPNCGAFINNIRIPLASHIHLDNGTTGGTSSLTLNTTSSPAVVGCPKRITVPFRSFLTSGDVTVTISGDAQFTLYDPNTNTTGANSYVMLSGANQCGVKNGASGSDYSGTNHTPGDATLQNITVWYIPTAANATNTATITITNGTSTATAAITASSNNPTSSCTSDGKPYYYSGKSKWLSLYVHDDQNNTDYQIYQPGEWYNFPVFAPCAITSANNDITMYRSDNAASVTISYYGDFTDSGNDYYSQTFSINTSNSWYHPNITHKEVNYVKVLRNGGSSNKSVHFNNFALELARHARLVDDNNPYGSDTLSRSISSQVGTFVDNTFYLRSFLTTTNLRMVLISEDAATTKSSAAVSSIFRISFNGQTPDAQGYYTITTAGNICGFEGASGNRTSSTTPANPINTTLIPIQIQYSPDSVETRRAKLVFYDGTNVVACLHLSGTGLAQQVALNWLDAAEPQVVDSNCVGNFAECVAHQEIQVYYTSSDTTLIGLCDEDPYHPGHFRKIYGRTLDTTATVTAYFLPTSIYEMQDSISKPFRVSSKLAQTIVNIADNLSYPVSAGTVTLSARAVLSSDKTTLTNRPITYAIEDATTKSSVVTISDSTLTIVGVGKAVLIVTAAGDSTYEQCSKRIGIEVYDVTTCPTQYVVNQPAVSGNAFWITGKYVFQQTYTLTKPAGTLKSMHVSTNGNIYVIVKYTSNGTQTTVCDYHCGAASDKLFDDVVLPRNTSTITYQIYVVTATLNYSVTPLQVTQAKFFDAPVTPSVTFDSTAYRSSSPVQNIAATPYSALDINEISWRIEGPQASSFSLENPLDLQNLDCGANDVLSLNIKFTPQILGQCSATLYLTATVNGVQVERQIALSGLGVKRTQTLNWNGTASSGYYADRATRILLKAISNLRDADGNDLPITYTSADTTVATVAQDPSDDRWYLTMHTVGTALITASQAGDSITYPQSIYMNFQVLRGRLIFVGTQDDDWQKAVNWNIQLIPIATDSVLINHNCTIPDGTVGYVDTMTMNYPLTIMPSAMLDAGGICNSASTPITLKADTMHQGTVLLSGGNPYAVVENSFRGTVHPDNQWLNPDWQYRGFIGNNAYLTDWNDIVMFRWSETTNATTCWNDNEQTPIYYHSGSMNGEAWTGYCMANYSAAGNVQSYTTRLRPTKGTAAEHTYTLTRTTTGGGSPTAMNCGVNLITNSWSAPIDMASSAITYGANVQQTFYMLNTRTHSEYIADTIGSFVVYPSQTGWATAASQYIPAGQSFLVRTNANGEMLKIEAGALGSSPSGKMYAPRREDFNVLRIIINGESTADRLTLVENANCTSSFDNGYDGTKMMKDGTTQLYAVTSFGNTAVNADASFLGQVIGCVASKEGELCTLRFETDMLHGFDELYLYDRATGRYVDILSGATYTFYCSTADNRRFQIVGSRDDGSEYVTSSDRKIEVIGTRALLSGFSDNALEVYITDIAGNILWSSRVSNGPWFNLPDLPAGLYIIYCDGTSTKFIK